MKSENVNIPASRERKVLTFLVNWEMFGIDMEPLIEVREWDEPRPLPGAPRYVLGVTNLRGMLLPIIDLSERLGWARTKLSPRTCIVVVRLGDQPAGFVVDRVADIITINEAAMQPCPNISLKEKEAISGMVQVPAAKEAERETDTLILLDLAALNVTADVELAA